MTEPNEERASSPWKERWSNIGRKGEETKVKSSHGINQ